MKKRNEMPRGLRFTFVMVILLLLLLVALILNITIGSANIPAERVVSSLLEFIMNPSGNDAANLPTESIILFNIRLPRMLLAGILGGALAVSGFLLQNFFRNPIAGPFVLGISSGAKMVVGITMIFLSGILSKAGPWLLIAAAFMGSLIITAVVMIFSQKVKNMSLLLVVGIMVGYICSAVTDLCVTFASEQDIVNLTHWSMGTFSGTDWENIRTAAIVCIPVIIAVWLMSKPMGAYALGENYAKSMGIRIKPFRLALILLSSMLSACVTALVGPISFVGVAVPHITRTLLKSSKPAFVIPASFLCGAVFCVMCDLIARTALAPADINISTVTSVFGAPVVIWMIANRRKNEAV